MPDRDNAELWGGQSVADACKLRTPRELREAEFPYRELAKVLQILPPCSIHPVGSPGPLYLLNPIHLAECSMRAAPN
jgi:hypothetical protein